jgi:NAD(P)-dependent dehydrogenase (short-subunit alcohol dehydrogenase family)
MSQVWLITGTSRGLGRAFAEAALGSKRFGEDRAGEKMERS